MSLLLSLCMCSTRPAAVSRLSCRVTKLPCDSAGIDKPNIRRIIHYGAPATLEAYYQQARPQLLSTCCPRRVFTALRK